VVLLTALRISSFDSSAFEANPTLGEAKFVALTQVELTYSLLASTFPSTRRFIVDLVTYYNNGHFEEGNHFNTRSDLMSESIPMETMKGTDRRPGGEESVDDDDNSSQTMIISKKVSFDVTFDRASAKVNMTSSEPF
jgi:hypothetical protein